MLHKSGLYGFITLSVSDGSIISLPMGRRYKHINQAHEDKSPAFLLFCDSIDAEPNPFADLGFTLQPDAHIRIDKIYHSSQSEFRSRRNLSYCHGTENFGDSQNILSVHYYFNAWGKYTHALCKLNSIPFEQTLEQELILKDRAEIYGEGIEQLIKLKNAKFMALAKDVTEGFENITHLCLDNGYHPDELSAEIQRYTELCQNKISLVDDGKYAELNLFRRMLEIIQEKNTIIERADLPAGAPLIAPTSNILPRQSDSLDLSKAIRLKDKLTKQSEQIDHTTSTVILNQYMNSYNNLRLEVLFLNSRLGLKSDQKKAIQKLSLQISKLASAIEIFKNALYSGNLEQAKFIFPHCQDAIVPEIYEEFINRWLEACCDGSQLTAKLLRIGDFLFNECTLFNNFMYIKSLRFSGFSILHNAFISGNREIFAALLRYGANPTLPWLVTSEGYLIGGIEFMLNTGPDTCYYVDKLVEYGLKVDNSSPVLTLQELYSKAKILQSQRQGESSKPYDIILGSRVTLDARSPAKMRLSMCHAGTLISSPLIRYSCIKRENKPELYRAIARHSGLASLLVSLAYYIACDGVDLLYMTKSKNNGIQYAECLQIGAIVSANSAVGYEQAAINIISVFGLRSPMDSITKQRIIAIIDSLSHNKLQRIDRAQFATDAARMRIIVERLLENRVYQYASYHVLSINLMYCLLDNLSKDDVISIVMNFIFAAKLMEEYILVLHSYIQDPATNERAITSNAIIEQCILDEFNPKTFMLYSYAAQVGYISPYPEIKDLPGVTAAIDKAGLILKDPSKLRPEKRLELLTLYRTRQKWETMINAPRPWLMQS